MRRALVWFLILGLIVSLFFIVGCGGDEEGKEKPKGESEVTQENGEAPEGGASTEEGGGETAPDNPEGDSATDGGGNEAPADGSGDTPASEIPEGTDIIPDISTDMPTEEQLGAPIYPSASYVPNSGGSATSSGPEGEMAVYYAEFTTGDSFDKVLAFYEGRLGRPMQSDPTMRQAVWMLNHDDGTVTVVAVSPASGGLNIAIGRTTGDMDQY